jgi:hypothetical protein
MRSPSPAVSLTAWAAFILLAAAAEAQLGTLASKVLDQDSPGIAGAAEPDDAFGEVTATGDFNCDGFADVAIGMPHEDVDFDGTTYNSAGAVEVLFGGPAGVASHGSEILTQIDTPASGPNAETPETGDHFGAAVAAYVGGCGDRLAVGAPDEDFGPHSDAGKVFLFGYDTVNDHFFLRQTLLQSEIGQTDESGDEFGFALAPVALSAGGFDCPFGFGPSAGLAIGAPGEGLDPFTNDHGAVYVVRNRNCTVVGGQLDWETELCDEPVHCLVFDDDVFGDEDVKVQGDRFGEAISGRMFDRLIIGAPGRFVGFGEVLVTGGSTDQVFYQQFLDQGAGEENDHFGGVLVEGDFNGDTLLDLAIGIPDEDTSNNDLAAAGAVQILYANPNNPLHLKFTDTDLYTQEAVNGGGEELDRFGYSLAAGDFDHDGIDDLAIGTPLEDLGADEDTGVFHVLYGAGTGLELAGAQTFSQESGSIPESNEDCDRFGYALAAGNIDGANGSDLAIGIPGEGGTCVVVNGQPTPDNHEGAIAVLYGTEDGFLSRITVSGNTSFSEGAGSIGKLVHREGSAVIAASVHYAAASGTAMLNADFSPSSGDLTWSIGNFTIKSVGIPIIDDPNGEPSETLSLELSAPAVGVKIIDDSSSITITDNDTFVSFADGFETSATGAWTSSFATGNLFTRSSAARYAGLTGLRLGVNDTSAIYLQDELPYSSTYHARFYLRLLPLTMANGDFFEILSATDPDGDDVFKLYVIRVGSDRILRARAYTDTGAVVAGALVELPSGRHAIEIFWQRGVAGQMTLKIDGQLEDTISGVANNALRVDRVRFGAPEGFEAGTTGNFSVDEFASSAGANLNQVSAFVDVDKNTDPLWRSIHAMYNFEVTNGCQAGIALALKFCGADAVSREELAMFFVRAQDGPGAPLPADCLTAPFDDVGTGNPFCRFVQAIEQRGITAGCGGNNYCPKNPVRRGELAVLVLRALDGAGASPAPCATKPFGDVETSDPRCPFIQEIKERGISAGCGGGNYCPDQPLRRQELSLLFQKALAYRLPAFP